jgi:hypothetical protein
MAIPPPPTQSEAGSYAWTDWYGQLTLYLNNGNSIPWSVVQKAGSSLGDLATRQHGQLQSLAGSPDGYHLSFDQYAAIAGMVAGSVTSFNTRTGAVTLTSADVTTALTYTPLNRAFTVKAGDPTTTDITAGNTAVYKNSSTGAVKLWVNDGGTMKSVQLT